MKATVLVDNIPAGSLLGEWGLSIYIQRDGQNILLDTGASGLFLDNAKALGLDMEAVDFAVLSHAHYDHADGMARFFRANTNAPFYLRAGSRENCYKWENCLYKYIGLPRGVLAEYPERIRWAEGKYTLCPGVWLIPHTTPGLERIGRKNRLYLRDGNRWRPDDFAHEQSLVCETKPGLVVFNSCSHGGVENIVREVSAACDGRPVRAVVGGFHLYQYAPEEVREIAVRLRELGVREFYTGHCTGEEAFAVLREVLGEQVVQLHAGLVMEF